MGKSKGIMLITLVITVIVMIMLFAIMLNSCEINVYQEGVIRLCPTCGKEL